MHSALFPWKPTNFAKTPARQEDGGYTGRRHLAFVELRFLLYSITQHSFRTAVAAVLQWPTLYVFRCNYFEHPGATRGSARSARLSH